MPRFTFTARPLASSVLAVMLSSFHALSVGANAVAAPDGTAFQVPPSVTITPKTGEQGKNFDVLLQTDDCKPGLQNTILTAPQQSGLTITELGPSSPDGCIKQFTISIRRDATLGTVALTLQYQTAKGKVGGTLGIVTVVAFEVTGPRPRQPVATATPSSVTLETKDAFEVAVASSDCEQQPLGDLTVESLANNGIQVIGVGQVISGGCQQLIKLQLTKDARIGPVPLLLKKKTVSGTSSIVGRVAFEVVAKAPNSGTGVPDNRTGQNGAISINPASGVLGQTYGVTIKATDCTKLTVKGLDLVAPQGSGLGISDPKESDDGCSMEASIAIDSKARVGIVTLAMEGPAVAQIGPGTSGTNPTSPSSLSQKSSGNESAPTKTIKATAEFEIIPATPGPIPPGLSPQVDVTWTVIPDNVARDNFGAFISRRFFCVQLAIGNNSGYPIQISNVHFSGIPGSKLTSVSYRAARASLERGQKEDPIRRFRQGVTITFGIATALLPLGGAGTTTAEGVLAVLSNATPGAIDTIFPDLTTDELNRLDDQTLKDGLIIPNNSEPTIVKAFVPKNDLASLVPDENSLKPRATALIGGSPKEGDLISIWINNKPTFYQVGKDDTSSSITANIAVAINEVAQKLQAPVVATAWTNVLTVTWLVSPLSDPVPLSATAVGGTTIVTSGPFLVTPVPTECARA